MIYFVRACSLCVRAVEVNMKKFILCVFVCVALCVVACGSFRIGELKDVEYTSNEKTLEPLDILEVF